MNQAIHPAFEFRTTPKNNWELVWWAFTDTNRIQKHVENLQLRWWQERLLFLKVYLFYLLPVSIIVTLFWWLLGISLMAASDLLNITSAEWWEPKALESWQCLPNFAAKWQYLFTHQLLEVLKGLAGGFALGFALGLAFGLALGFALGLVFGLALGLAFGLAYGLAFSLVFGLYLGLYSGLVGNWALGLVFGLVFGLVLGLGVSLAVGLAVGLPILTMYLVHYCLMHYKLSLTHNSYLWSDRIDMSLSAETKLIAQSQENPELALQFVGFLWQHRPKQHDLAALLSHVAVSEQWKNAAIHLETKALIFPLTREQKSFEIPTLWQEQLEDVKNSLTTAQTTPHINLRVEGFAKVLEAIEALYQSTLVAPQKTWRDELFMTRRINWRTYYKEAVEEWRKIVKEKYKEEQEKAKLIEPITSNQYNTGGALSPHHNKNVFMARDDVRHQLEIQLVTTQNFSVFFLQGQRRVGKSSLLKFMPEILGSGFVQCYMDLQGSIRSVPDFLRKWHKAFCKDMGIKNADPLPESAHWSEIFAGLSELFLKIAQAKGKKIILALDEYEELHVHLQKDPTKGRELLSAMRNFSQHQREVILMFVGLQFFSELEKPNWNEYFPQSVPIRVGYLNREKTLQLVAVSKLDFDEGLPQRIYDLTQGQPSLVQKICYELVQIANRDGRRHLTFADLDESLKKMIYIMNNGVTDIFWTQSCESDLDKNIVRAIVARQPLPNGLKTNSRLSRLLDYGFVIENDNSADYPYRMCAPIFQTWVERYG